MLPPSPPELSNTDLVQFVESHRPYLEDGIYHVDVTHTLDTGKENGTESFSAKQAQFYVKGERFTLPQALIHAVYPSPGASGIYDHVLPHVILNRSSLPWERTPLNAEEPDAYSPSWMALLVFSEDELSKIKAHSLPVDALANQTTSFGAGLRTEPGQHGSDIVNVIDVPMEILRNVLPRYDDLPGLAHVRRVSAAVSDDLSGGLTIRPAEGMEDATTADTAPPAAKGIETAHIIANRLPPCDTVCTVHLVSLEDRFVQPKKPNSWTRVAREIKDTLLVDLLRQAKAKRDEDGVLGYDLTLREGRKPRLKKVDDRDMAESDDGDTISAASLLQADQVDNMCKALLGDNLDLLKLLPEKRDFQRLTDAQGKHIGLFEISVRNRGWKPQDLKPKDVAHLADYLPDASPSVPVELTCTGPNQATGKVETAISAWVVSAALRKLKLHRERVITGLNAIRKTISLSSEPTNIVEYLSDRSQIKPKLAALEAADTSPELRRLVAAFAGSGLTVPLVANGIMFEAKVSAKGQGIAVTLFSRAHRMTARIRALRDEPEFDDASPASDVPARLVTLKSWSFYNKGEQRGFERELLDLNPVLGTDPDAPRDDLMTYEAASGAFHMPVPPALPDATPAQKIAQARARAMIADGAVVLRHRLRGGEQTLSWYRGPFVNAGFRPPPLPLPASAADALIIYDKPTGMFDTSYAAAWELGRLIALEDNEFALALVHWKKNHARTLAHLRQRIDEDFLPLVRSTGPSAIPKRIQSGFASLSRLEPVPFNYLVPDEKMLPVDSIRFFDVDPMWLEALRDGAFSVGRVLSQDNLEESDRSQQIKKPIRLSGCLLRSQVVGDWPLMRIDGFTKGSAKRPSTKLTLERFSKLGRSLSLCLFSDPARAGGRVDAVDIHLPAEVLHFGLEVSSEPSSPTDRANGPSLIKQLRDPNTGLDLCAWRGNADNHPDHARFEVDVGGLEILMQLGVGPSIISALQAQHGRLFDTISEICSAAGLDPNLPINTARTLGTLLAKVVRPLGPVDQVIHTIPFRPNAASRVLDVTGLMSQVATHLAPAYPRGHRFSVADFALQMLDLPPLVRFERLASEGKGPA
jgi:hypothetical protein